MTKAEQAYEEAQCTARVGSSYESTRLAAMQAHAQEFAEWIMTNYWEREDYEDGWRWYKWCAYTKGKEDLRLTTAELYHIFNNEK